MKGKDRMER